MSSQIQFPTKKFYETLSDTSELEKKLKFFINEYKNHNMHWIYQSISVFQRILSSNKQSPMVKFNALLAIKHCFDTCEYVLLTLIQVFLLNKITEIALFRYKIKDDSLITTYFATEGYKEVEHNDLKKISFNFVMLASQFVFIAAQVKNFRCVQNIQLKQVSKYAMSAQFLIDKGIKRPQKFSFFLSDYVKDSSKKYQNKLKQFGEQICEIYSQYFLGIIIAQIQTGKKGPLQIKNLLSFGDAYLTSAMINLCEDELSSMQDGFQNKKKYLNLFNEFVRWGDIEAILMVNNSDFVTQISINICTVRGDVNINQGQNIYPQIDGKKNQKKEFYIDFLRCVETWAECIPLNEQGLESNVRRIYIFLKQQKKFKFPQNLVLKRYKKQIQQNMKKNQQRNQKLLQIINNLDQEDEDEQDISNTINATKKTVQMKKEEPVTFEFLQNKIKNVEKVLQQMISMKQNQKEATTKLSLKFDILKSFNDNWAEWLEKIDLQTQQIEEQDQQMLQEMIIKGDQTMQAVQIINPLIQMFKKNKISLQEFLKRIKQNLEIHQDLTISRSKQLDLTKSMGKSVKKDLSNTIQKSILKKSHKKVMSSSKAEASNHHLSRHLVASIYKSKNLANLNKNLQKSNMMNSLYKSHQKSGLSSIRHSRIHQKLQRIKQNSSQFGQLIQSRNHVTQSAQEYFQQNNSIGLKNYKKEQNVKDNLSSISNSLKSVQKQSSSKNLHSRASFQSSKQNGLSQLIHSPGSSKNFKSQKNITIVSRNFSQKHEVLEQDSKKVVEDMDISDEAQKIVVQYSDIDENQIQKKANQRQKQQILKNQQRKSKSKKTQEAFLKIKIQQKKVQPNQKLQKSSNNQNIKSPRNEVKKVTSTKNIQYLNESNKIKMSEQKNQLNIESPIQKKSSSANRNSNKIIPFDEDYGGKQTKINKFDEVETPKRFQKLQRTKKSQSKISIISDDKNESVRSSKSIRQKIKNRIIQKNSLISQRKSLLKDPTERSLESQIRAMKIQEGSNQSRSLNRKKQGIRVTQINQRSKINMDCNQEYNYLPKRVLQNEQNSEDLNKTKKISQSKIDPKQKDQILHLNKNQKQQTNIRISRDISSSSLRSRPYRQGISLSLGKRGSILKNQSSLIKRGSILRKNQHYLVKKQKQENKGIDDLRPQYFNQHMKRQKHSNRSQIKKKLNDHQLQSQSDSSCGDLIHLPDNRPLVQSHYTNKDSKKPINQKLEFKNYIQNGLKQQLISGKNRQLDSLIKDSSKRQQIQRIIQYNPNNRKAKSQQKMVYGSLLRDKSTQKQVSYLQSRVKALQQQTKNMKTKLAIKDHQVKSFRNTSQKMQFSNPSQSNCYTSSEGFKYSRLGSQKGNFSPMTHNFLNSGFQDSQIMKHAKSSQYNQYFQKIKSNTLKKTLLKSKCLIEKQNQIEIGCMSVRKQDFSLEVTVFVTPLRFDITDINYSIIHDDNIFTQCHPKKVINIQMKKQQKISIKMNVKRIPFSIPQFQLTYKSKSEYSTNYFRLPIPIIFNKFCQLQAVSTQSLQSKLIVPDRALVTSQFKLNTKVVKLEKIKEILPNFSYSKNKDFHILTSYGNYKESSFWLIIKINEKNRAVIQGVMNQGQNLKILEFLMVTFKNIFESQK